MAVKWPREWSWQAISAAVVAGLVVAALVAAIAHFWSEGSTDRMDGTNSDPQSQIVKLTGSWSEQGFVNAIIDRQTKIVALYLKSGMSATTLHEGASAILFGFQMDQNGDPVALVKTFQADGFELDDELQDSSLMPRLTDGLMPLQFETNLTPKGYTGGYQDGKFVGALLFWIVADSAYAGVTDQDQKALQYLIAQGADCKVALSYLDYATKTDQLLDTGTPYRELYPMIKACAS
jgi:hypothetical protein